MAKKKTKKKVKRKAKKKVAKRKAKKKAKKKTATEKTQKKQKRGGTDNLIPWKPGQSGNPAGRPKGARNKFSEAFLEDFHADWEAHGLDVIKKVRDKKPAVYLKVAASILPKELNVGGLDDLRNHSAEQLEARVREELRWRLTAAGLKGKALDAEIERTINVLIEGDGGQGGKPPRTQ